MKLLIVSLRTVTMLLFTLAFSCVSLVQVCVGQESVEPRVIVLSTYLASQARNTRLEQAAKAAELDFAILSAEQLTPEELEKSLGNCRLLLIDAPHISVAKSLATKFGRVIQKSASKYLLIGEFTLVAKNEVTIAEPLQAESGVAVAWAQRIREYWRFGGEANVQLAMAALKGDYSRSDLSPAITIPLQGYYHPDWPNILTDPALVLKSHREAVRPNASSESKVVAIAVNSGVFTSGDMNWLDSLVASIEQRGLLAYVFFGPRQNANLFYEMTRMPDGKQSMADLIVNAALVFKPNERKVELDRIGVPVLQTLPSLAMDREQWQASSEGLALADISYYYTSSELAGMIDPVLISARDKASGVTQPIQSQMDGVAAKAAAIIRLRHTPTAERQLAVFVYNYPQGESNFGASFLNVPKSLENIFSGLQGSGYTTQAVKAEDVTQQLKQTMTAFYKPESIGTLIEDDLAATLPLTEYLAWFRKLPFATQERIETYWGSPEASAVEWNPQLSNGGLQFVIPRIAFGNVVVLPQPPRHPVNASIDLEKKASRIHHRSSVPLSHQYLATYLWLRISRQANAVIHLGTHGTVEWSPGKERGLSMHDDPYLALDDLPNIYPYIMDNLGEAITAKRRGRATIISHLTPMFSPAGFRPGFHEMHDLMHDWETVSPGPVRKEMEAQLLTYFVEHHLHRDLNWTESEIAADFEGFLEQLHPYLDDIAQSAQPQGLAAFGEVPSVDRRFGMVMQMLRKPMIDALGEDIDEVFLLDSEKVLNSRPARWLRVALRDPVAASRLDLRKIDAVENTVKSSVPNRAESKVLEPTVLFSLAKRAQQLELALATNEELSNLLAALDGKHVAASYGGDPVRNPESLPTGRNLYGFDPSRVPTLQAWTSGVAAFDNWAQQHRDSHAGKWPEKIAYSLWAGETMRHQGIMESQVLWALGVKPIWDETGRVSGLEVVSNNDLGRPRIDVLLSVTGSYRDQFPLVMQWIDQAVQQVAALDEDNNFVAVHTNALRDLFCSQGMTKIEATQHATVRVFSNEAGGYGTGLSDAVLATDVWKNDSKQAANEEMSELFINRMGYAFGSGLNGVDASEAFAQHLTQVDAALLSRTSHTYGVLTSDDPYQYLGGLSLAIRELTGKSPSLYVQNLRDETEITTDNAGLSIAKEMNSRYLHPQWIKAQQAEGYSGTLQVLKASQFLWGWQVTAPETIRQDQWQSFHDIYIRDRYRLGTEKWMRESNHTALAQMLERMLDAVRLGYWQPDAETRQELVSAYLQAADESNLIDRNMAVTRFADIESVKLKADQRLRDSLVKSIVEPAAPMVPNGSTTASIESSEVASLSPNQKPLTSPSQHVSGISLQIAPDAMLPSEMPKKWFAWSVVLLLFVLGAVRASQRIQ